MSAYRFCRTDDIELLVEALNRCWLPYFPDEAPMTAAAFKRSIRDLQVWCSSCMVAFSGSDPIAVLIGAKRPSGTLIDKIAVHPDHRRQGHARHLLASLASKLAILGPPRIVAEVPEGLGAACALFAACGYRQEAALRDYALEGTAACRETEGPRASQPASDRVDDTKIARFVIPIDVDDLTANGGLAEPVQQVCWSRSAEALSASKADIAGLAIASDERIEAYVLYRTDECERTEIVSLRSWIDDGGARLSQLLRHLDGRGRATLRIPRVHPAEIPGEWLQRLGFRPMGAHLLFAATASAA